VASEEAKGRIAMLWERFRIGAVVGGVAIFV
jgi:hypothetical protein